MPQLIAYFLLRECAEIVWGLENMMCEQGGDKDTIFDGGVGMGEFLSPCHSPWV